MIETKIQRQHRVLIIGAGTTMRGDDAAGLYIAQKLKREKMANVMIAETDEDIGDLMELWENDDIVILADAVSARAAPGTILRFDARERSIPAKLFRCLTHTFSISDSIELARSKNRLPPFIILYGIEGKRYDAGKGLSKEVKSAADEVVRLILTEVGVLCSILNIEVSRT